MSAMKTQYTSAIEGLTSLHARMMTDDSWREWDDE